MVMSDIPSSPPRGTSAEDSLAWYKTQYEQLESELAEFQASSRELEAELEKDLDAADKRERALKAKAETLSFEAEEWKRKYKESKAEANAASNALEKEVTALRESNRTLQMKLRDIEVANDDFERQARHTTSSLEDLESKHNVAIERAVMMEEELRLVEQEREQLRVESQRLREELSDTKIEVEILQDKITKQEERHLSTTISTDISLPASPTFDRIHSPTSTASSPPLISTPPDPKTLSVAGGMSDMQHPPPSPPMSDASAPPARAASTSSRTPASHHLHHKSRLPSMGSRTAPQSRHYTQPMTTTAVAATPAPSSSGRLSSGSAYLATPNHPPRRPTLTKPTASTKIKGAQSSRPIANSTSLTHIRSLTAQMARLEARVQSVRLKLPGPALPVATPTRPSPQPFGGVPSTITVRSRKRTAGSTTPSVVSGGHDASSITTPSHPSGSTTNHSNADFHSSHTSKHVPRLSASGVSNNRLSFGPLPNRGPTGPLDMSRPSSRASVSGIARPASRADDRSMAAPPRPVSRTSGRSSARTPLGRPPSALGGSVHGHSHGGHGHHAHSHSISHTGSGNYMREHDDEEPADKCGGVLGIPRTPSRRGTFRQMDGLGDGSVSGLPLPSSGIPLSSSVVPGAGVGARRKSGGVGVVRRSGSGITPATKLTDVGETY